MESGTVFALSMVALGGAIGALVRYGFTKIIDTSEFPWATFVVNLIACTLASFVVFGFAGRMNEMVRCLMVVGFFGAMSTMSTFTTESVRFLFDSEYGRFTLNVVLNVGVCLVGAIIGRELSLLV